MFKLSPFKIAFIAVAFRLLLFLYTLVSNPKGFLLHDSYEYLELGRNMFLSGEFSREFNGTLYPEHIRVPGFPAWVGFFSWLGLPDWFMSLVNILLSGCSAILLYKIIQLKGTERYARILTIMFALDPGHALLSVTVMSEFLCEVLVYGFLYLLYQYLNTGRIRALYCAAVLLGLGIMVRPALLFLPTVLALVLLKRPSRSKVIYFLALAYVLPFLWCIRNLVVFNTFFYSNVGLQNLVFLKAAQIRAEEEHTTIEFQTDKYRQDLQVLFRKDSTGIYTHDVPAYYALARERAISDLAAHPLTLLGVNGKNAIKFFFNPPTAYFNLVTQPAYTSVAYQSRELSLVEKFQTHLFSGTYKSVIFSLIYFLHLGILLCFIGRAVLAWFSPNVHPEKTLIKACVFAILYFTVISLGPEADARLRLAIMPYLYISLGLILSDKYEGTKI